MPTTEQQAPQFARGLEGVIAAETKIGFVDGTLGRLVYRGFDITTLVENSSFEEVSYLLLYGKLPNKKEYTDFIKKLKKLRILKNDEYDLIRQIAGKAHPMSSLRTVVSYIGAKDSRSVEPTVEQQEELGLELIAKMPTIVGAIHRIHKGHEIVKPDDSLSISSDFFYQSLGRKPSDIEAKMLDAALILHADHGMNASTFSSMLTISTLSDMYSAVTSAIGTLKGPLHGGANEKALALIKKVGDPSNAEKIIGQMIINKEKIMGFGHRVYKVYDPRAKILREFAGEITKMHGTQRLFETANKIEEVMISKLGSRGIFPNVDFYSGILYSSIGFDSEIFTPIFAVSRITGWVARSLEYVRDNRLYRPKALYTGESGPFPYVPMDERE
ncbi:MAG: citrate/2-methylcitrate synthase [Thermoplasmataceae archaeon]